MPLRLLCVVAGGTEVVLWWAPFLLLSFFIMSFMRTNRSSFDLISFMRSLKSRWIWLRLPLILS
jgi:hypothetical protein